jgi:uncharacterized protein (TIGR02466 family)
MKQYAPSRATTNTMMLFGTPIFLYDKYSNPGEIHNTTNEQKEVTLNRDQNFSSTEASILELDSYKEIKNRITDGLHEYVRDVLHIEDRYEFYITQSWLNINPPGTGHHVHNHSNSIISGVYYIDTSAGASITFVSQNNTNVTSNPTLTITVNEYTLANSSSWAVPVKNNDIIYFPSTTLHHVGPNSSDRNRISLAFNCFVKGHFGAKNNLNELYL